MDEDGINMLFDSKDKALEAIQDKKQNQQGFRITPKMREKVLKEGQPLSFNLLDGVMPDVDAGSFV